MGIIMITRASQHRKSLNTMFPGTGSCSSLLAKQKPVDMNQTMLCKWKVKNNAFLPWPKEEGRLNNMDREISYLLSHVETDLEHVFVSLLFNLHVMKDKL